MLARPMSRSSEAAPSPADDDAAARRRFTETEHAEFDSNMRSPASVVSALAAVAVVPLAHLIPGASSVTGITFEQASLINAPVLLAMSLATVSYWRWGYASWQYRACDSFENWAIQVALGLMIVVPGRPDSVFWLFYIVHALILSIHPAASWLQALPFVCTPVWVGAALALRTGSSAGIVAAAFALGLALMLTAIAGGFRRRVSQLSFERTRLEQRVAALLVEGERGRIARELHDGLTADLTAIAWRAAVFAKSPPEREIGGEFDAIARRARAAIDDTKAMVWALRDDEVTWSAVAAHVRSRCAELCEGRVALECALPRDTTTVSGQLAVDIVRIVQESVRNALQHGGAHRVRVAITIGSSIEVEIEDDGVGIAPASAGDTRIHGGLRNLERRARQHGGDLRIDALDPGTRVHVRLPRLVAVASQ